MRVHVLWIIGAAAIILHAQDDVQEHLQTLFGKGLNALNRGEYTEAVRWYSECLMIDSMSTNARFNRATAFIKMGDQAKAKADLDHILLYRPELLNARMQRAVVHANMGLSTMARADLDTIIRIDSTFPRAYILRGRMKMAEFADEAGACADLREALKVGDSTALRYMSPQCRKTVSP